MSAKMIILSGTLPHLDAENARRLAVYLVRGDTILAHTHVQQDGNVRLQLARHTLTLRSAYSLEIVVGPAGFGAHLDRVPDLQRISLSVEHLEKSKDEMHLPLAEIRLDEEILARWWLWCRWYCVHGTVVAPDGCPAPGAQVTVYTVAHSGSGYTQTPRATVTTDANGHFTACFGWCTCRECWPCWPCWPFWWLCWPWWWELDLLYVLEHIEQIAPQLQAVQRSPLAPQQGALALNQPPARDLMRGQGFAAVQKRDAIVTPDAARTALIQRKLANAAIREVFPWWWWCCDDPNILFSVTQGPNTIVTEDPATATRWCLEDGSTFTLRGNRETIGACPGGPQPVHGFVWTRVKNITVDHIHDGYADGFGLTDTTDMAFAGMLDIYGEFAPASGVAYYQVNAGQWGGSGNPSRGGTAPSSSTAIGADLYNQVVILHTDLTITFADVKMGPFSSGGLTNLYATQEQRQSVPGGVLPPFPTVNPGDAVLWSFNGRKVATDAANLLAGSTVGGVDLTITGYDTGFAPVVLPSNPDDLLTLEIDTTGLTVTAINQLKAFRADNTPVTSVGSSGACPAYNLGPGGYVQINVTVTDANDHLFEYEVTPDFGSGSTGVTTPGLRGYRQPGPYPVAPYKAPNPALKAYGGGSEDITFFPTEDCCYDFRLLAGKRVTNGETFPYLGTAAFQTATLKVT